VNNDCEDILCLYIKYWSGLYQYLFVKGSPDQSDRRAIEGRKQRGCLDRTYKKKIKVWREIVERIRTLHRLDALPPLTWGVFLD
jgi:hypothetical protein